MAAPSSALGASALNKACAPQETSDKSVIELQQYAKKNKPNLHILSKLQEEMKRLAEERVHTAFPLPPPQNACCQEPPCTGTSAV